MRMTALLPVSVLFLSLAGCADHVSIAGDFELQPYELPKGYRHMTALIDEERKELVLFGGLGNGGPMPPTAMNHHIFTLDLRKPAAQRAWVMKPADTIVQAPWFTSTRGFVEVGNKTYLTCSDTDANEIYEFDKKSREFRWLSTSNLPPEVNAGDCCAVGVKVEGRGRGKKDDVRIYVLGGRNDVVSPVPYARYYSVTYDKWVKVANLNVGRSHLGCAPVETRRGPAIYAVGGGNSTAGTTLRSVEVYDVERDTWTLYGEMLPEGRSRLAVQNLDDEFLMLIGGDAACAGGGAGNLCTGDRPLANVDLIDMKRNNRFISGTDHWIPQLLTPRQTPATALRKKKHGDEWELHVIGGRTPAGAQLDVTTSSEVLSFDLRRAWLRF
ncbi:MAG: hypothetical protein KF819_32910 [Labilithrix sp.]|nr:hypothetical protein [Labilithrix sp.]